MDKVKKPKYVSATMEFMSVGFILLIFAAFIAEVSTILASVLGVVGLCLMVTSPWTRRVHKDES